MFDAGNMPQGRAEGERKLKDTRPKLMYIRLSSTAVGEYTQMRGQGC
jgi:hypothetical protein